MPTTTETTSAKLLDAMLHEEQILQGAVIKTLAKVQEKPTAENTRNHQAAKKALEDLQRKRQITANPDEMIFKTVAEAFRYAVDNGYRRSRQTMDNHIESGLLVRLPDSRISKPAVDAYLAMQAGTGADTSKAELELRDQAAKTKKTEAQAEVWDIRARRERGELIIRSDIEDMLAQRAQFLRQDLESFFRVLAPDVVALVQGDEDRVFDLTEFGLERLEEYLDRYSRPLPIGEVHQVNLPENSPPVPITENGQGSRTGQKSGTAAQDQTND